jgi:hypothetical protein
MGRHKKIKNIQLEEKREVVMAVDTEDQVNTLESLESEIDRTRAELEAVKLELEEKKQQSKALPMREVDADEMILVKKQQSRSTAGKAAADMIEKKKASDNVMVTGKFINRRAPGQPAKLTYLKYEDDPVKWYTLEDGKVYTLPRGFADQINEHYYTPHFTQKQGLMDPNAPTSAIHDIDTSNKKYAFTPVNF